MLDRISTTALESPINGMKVRTSDDPVDTSGNGEDRQVVAESDRN